MHFIKLIVVFTMAFWCVVCVRWIYVVLRTWKQKNVTFDVPVGASLVQLLLTYAVITTYQGKFPIAIIAATALLSLVAGCICVDTTKRILQASREQRPTRSTLN